MYASHCLISYTSYFFLFRHRKNKKVTTQSPLYEEPDEIRRELFARKYNRAELTLNIDELMR